MGDLTQGINPQRVREEEGNTDILNEILVELKKMNTYLALISDIVINNEDIINCNEDAGP